MKACGSWLCLIEWNRRDVAREMVIERRNRGNQWLFTNSVDAWTLPNFHVSCCHLINRLPRGCSQNSLSVVLFMAGPQDLSEEVNRQRISMSQFLGQNVLRIVFPYIREGKKCVYPGHMLLIGKLNVSLARLVLMESLWHLLKPQVKSSELPNC